VPAKKKDIEKKRRERREGEWEGVDEKLFILLRAKRAELARKKGVPAYIVFGDNTLRDIALRKPISMDQFAEVFGVGATKRQEYGEVFISLVKDYVTNH
jgi:ATP-dependent DNA helicase RecQ